MKPIAIIGAGVAGCIAAHNLSKLGYATQVFDKSRGVGGRMATRRSSAGEFDHGARCFTAASAEFSRALSQAPVKLWPEADAKTKRQCFVATPRQNQLAKFWLGTAPAQLNCKIDQLQQNSDGWRLVSDRQQTFGPFKGVVLAIPAPQACDLLANSELAIPEALTPVSMDPVWALMFSLETPLSEAIYSDPGPSLSWLGANFTKPDRPEPTDSYAYVAHASRQWSHEHLALDNHLILAGDWCLGAEVEDAFRSGTEAALQMHRELASTS